MRINSCPIPYLCLSFSVISIDLPSSFLTFPPRVASFHPVVSSSSSILHLSLKCFSYLRSPLSSTPPPPTHTHRSLSIAILPQSPFFLCLSSLDRGVSQQRWLSISEKSLYHVAVGCGWWSCFGGGPRYNCYFVKCTRTQPRSIRHACQTAPRGPPPIPEPSHVKEPSPSHRLPPSYPPPSLRKSEIAVHTQPSTTSQSY